MKKKTPGIYIKLHFNGCFYVMDAFQTQPLTAIAVPKGGKNEKDDRVKASYDRNINTLSPGDFSSLTLEEWTTKVGRIIIPLFQMGFPNNPLEKYKDQELRVLTLIVPVLKSSPGTKWKIVFMDGPGRMLWMIASQLLKFQRLQDVALVCVEIEEEPHKVHEATFPKEVQNCFGDILDPRFHTGENTIVYMNFMGTDNGKLRQNILDATKSICCSVMMSFFTRSRSKKVRCHNKKSLTVHGLKRDALRQGFEPVSKCGFFYTCARRPRVAYRKSRN